MGALEMVEDVIRCASWCDTMMWSIPDHDSTSPSRLRC